MSSKREREVQKMLFDIFRLDDYWSICNGRHSFLLSQKGYPMELDWFCPELRLAVEVDGKQHEEYVPFIQDSKLEHREQKARDKRKDRTCKTKNIALVRIKHDEDLTKRHLVSKITNKAPRLESTIKEILNDNNSPKGQSSKDQRDSNQRDNQ